MRMSLRLGLGWFTVAALALSVATFSFFTPTFAQQNNQTPHFAGDIEDLRPLPAGGPAPRTADGHPDLNGVWYPNQAGTEVQIAYLSAAPGVAEAQRQFDPKVTPQEPPSFKPGMAAKSMVRPRAASDYGECNEHATPITYLGGNATWPIQIIQNPGLVVMLDEYPRDYRLIRTDGRPHPKDPDPTFDGDSIGHWEGDTLVIDTIAIDQQVLGPGTPAWHHSDQERVITHISRPSMNYIVIQGTVEDPAVLAKPWNSAPHRWSMSIHKNEDIGEFFCSNNEEPTEYKKITDTANSKSK